MVIKSQDRYFTERGNALLAPVHNYTSPVIALEDYDKWYSIYVIINGEVNVIDVDLVLKYTDGTWCDHCYHPDLLEKLAEHYGGIVDERSSEVAMGRWYFEVEYR